MNAVEPLSAATVQEAASRILASEEFVTVTVPFEYCELVQRITLAPATLIVIVPEFV